MAINWFSIRHNDNPIAPSGIKTPQHIRMMSQTRLSVRQHRYSLYLKANLTLPILRNAILTRKYAGLIAMLSIYWSPRREQLRTRLIIYLINSILMISISTTIPMPINIDTEPCVYRNGDASIAMRRSMRKRRNTSTVGREIILIGQDNYGWWRRGVLGFNPDRNFFSMQSFS